MSSWRMETSQTPSQILSNASLAASWLSTADCVLIAAGAGASFESGIDDITPEGFLRKFPSMVKRGYPTMLEAIGVDFHNDPLLAWGYYATRMKWYRETEPHEGYHILLRLLKQLNVNDYYIFTSNVDGLFVKAGFDQERVYEKQGSYKYLQCIRNVIADLLVHRGPECSTDIWLAKEALSDTEKAVHEETLILKDPALLPRCRKCGSLAYHNANANEYWVHNLYDQQRLKFHNWLNSTVDKKLVIVEIGCGSRLPFIRHPCESIWQHHPHATLIRINPSEPEVPDSENSIGLPLGFIEGINKISLALQSKP